MSSKALDQATERTLAKCFNFAITASQIPIENIICEIEKAITHLEPNTAKTLRQETSAILRKAKPPKKNISREEIQALHNLRKDKSIIVLSADKGNATVVLEDYNQKMLDLLNNPSYKAIATDPTIYLEKTTKTLINKSWRKRQKRKLFLEQNRQCALNYMAYQKFTKQEPL